MQRRLLFLFILFFLFSCLSEQAPPDNRLTNTVEVNLGIQSTPVKSILLYDTIQRWPIDTILAALVDINAVIATIESREAGYSLWKVQSDTIPDYRYFIQGHWPDQASYDTIHVNPDFRKELDRNVRIFTETRKWDLYRRYELVK